MGVRRIPRPRSRGQLSTGTLVDTSDQAALSRHLSDLADRVSAADSSATSVSSRHVTLNVGTNKVNHGLGRKALGVHITPTVADATWAWALTLADDKQVTITCVGVAQPNAFVEVV